MRTSSLELGRIEGWKKKKRVSFFVWKKKKPRLKSFSGFRGGFWFPRRRQRDSEGLYLSSAAARHRLRSFFRVSRGFLVLPPAATARKNSKNRKKKPEKKTRKKPEKANLSSHLPLGAEACPTASPRRSRSLRPRRTCGPCPALGLERLRLRLREREREREREKWNLRGW